MPSPILERARKEQPRTPPELAAAAQQRQEEQAWPTGPAKRGDVQWISLPSLPEAEGDGLCVCYDTALKEMFSCGPSEISYACGDDNFRVQDENDDDEKEIFRVIRCSLPSRHVSSHIMLAHCGTVWACGVDSNRKKRVQAAKAALAVAVAIDRSQSLVALDPLVEQCKAMRDARAARTC